MGAQLSLDLQTSYSLPPIPVGTGLRSVYDLSVRASKSSGAESPASFLANKFIGCSSPDWYQHVVKVPWRIIWTLNIDDVLENAYQQRFKAIARQELRLVSWDSKNVFHREPSGPRYGSPSPRSGRRGEPRVRLNGVLSRNPACRISSPTVLGCIGGCSGYRCRSNARR